MKRFSPDHLRTASAAEISTALKTSKCSLLKSIGANRLRIEMLLVGSLCRFVLWFILLDPKKGRARACRVVNFFFPTTVVANHYAYFRPDKKDTAIVGYFNHQSLFEVLATIAWCLHNFPDKNYIFPVNLPWYEALAPVAAKLLQIGIDISPLITPKTYKKLQKFKHVDIALVDRLKAIFERQYFALAGDYAINHGVIAIAPSAGRTPTIFESETAFHSGNDHALGGSPKVISAILLAIKRASKQSGHSPLVDFVPLVVTCHGRIRGGLNVFRHHHMFIGHALGLGQMQRLREQHKDNFVAYRKLADYLPTNIKYPKAAG